MARQQTNHLWIISLTTTRKKKVDKSGLSVDSNGSSADKSDGPAFDESSSDDDEIFLSPKCDSDSESTCSLKPGQVCSVQLKCSSPKMFIESTFVGWTTNEQPFFQPSDARKFLNPMFPCKPNHDTSTEIDGKMCERKNWTHQKLTPNVNIEKIQKESRCSTPTKLCFQGAKNNTPLIDAEKTAHQTRQQFSWKKHWENQVNYGLLECSCIRNKRPCSLKDICEDDKTKNNSHRKCVGCQKRVQCDGKQKLKTCRGSCRVGKTSFCHQCYDDNDDKVYYCIHKKELKNCVNSESNGQFLKKRLNKHFTIVSNEQRQNHRCWMCANRVELVPNTMTWRSCSCRSMHQNYTKPLMICGNCFNERIREVESEEDSSDESNLGADFQSLISETLPLQKQNHQ